MTKPHATPSVPAGMVPVTREEFFDLLKADKRDIMPRNSAETFTSWEVAHTREVWGWSTPGWKYPGDPHRYAIKA